MYSSNLQPSIFTNSSSIFAQPQHITSCCHSTSSLQEYQSPLQQPLCCSTSHSPSTTDHHQRCSNNHPWWSTKHSGRLLQPCEQPAHHAPTAQHQIPPWGSHFPAAQLITARVCTFFNTHSPCVIWVVPIPESLAIYISIRNGMERNGTYDGIIKVF